MILVVSFIVSFSAVLAARDSDKISKTYPVRPPVTIKTASGDVKALQVVVTDESSFSSASGNAVVSLSSTPGADLALSSASGSAVLKLNGNEVKGEVEFTALRHGGDITSPFDFDDESSFRRDGHEYVKKSFSRNSKNPLIKISTSSGEAILEE